MEPEPLTLKIKKQQTTMQGHFNIYMSRMPQRNLRADSHHQMFLSFLPLYRPNFCLLHTGWKSKQDKCSKVPQAEEQMEWRRNGRPGPGSTQGAKQITHLKADPTTLPSYSCRTTEHRYFRCFLYYPKTWNIWPVLFKCSWLTQVAAASLRAEVSSCSHNPVLYIKLPSPKA